MNKFRNLEEIKKAIETQEGLLKTFKTDWARKAATMRIEQLKNFMKEGK